MSDMKERLEHLASMEDGWHDGQGKAPRSPAVYVARRMADLFAKTPGIFPTDDGGIQFEWFDAEGCIVFEVGPRGGTRGSVVLFGQR